MDARKHVAASWDDADDDEASAPAQEPALVAESWEDSDAELEVPSSRKEEADAEEPAAKEAEEPVANAAEEAVVKEFAALSPTSAEPQPAMPLPPRLAKDWRTPPKMTGAQKKELSKRLLQCETVFGLVASVHLEKVNARSGEHMELGRSVYSWIFDAHHIVLGDVNCEWRNMIGGAFFDRGGTSKEVKMEAWVKPETHAAAIRPGGTYLPGVTQEKVPRWKGDKVTIDPPAFDLVVVTRPYAVDLLKKQPGRAFQPAKLPRLLMQSLPPDGWPSDHTSVVAVVRAASSQPARTLRVATWNVADPWYFSQFWGEACSFGFEREREAQRLEHIERHVAQARAARSLLAPPPRAPHNHAPHPLAPHPPSPARAQLLDASDVLGLQEVPVLLVKRLVRLGAHRDFEAQWVGAPSDKDTALYEQAVGRRSGTMFRMLSEELPPVPHDMLLARRSVLSTERAETERGVSQSTCEAKIEA